MPARNTAKPKQGTCNHSFTHEGYRYAGHFGQSDAKSAHNLASIFDAEYVLTQGVPLGTYGTVNTTTAAGVAAASGSGGGTTVNNTNDSEAMEAASGSGGGTTTANPSNYGAGTYQNPTPSNSGTSANPSNYGAGTYGTVNTTSAAGVAAASGSWYTNDGIVNFANQAVWNELKERGYALAEREQIRKYAKAELDGGKTQYDSLDLSESLAIANKYGITPSFGLEQHVGGGDSGQTSQPAAPTDTRTPEQKEADFYKALSDATEAAANGNPQPLKDFDSFFGITRPAEEYTAAFYQAKAYNIDTHTYNGIMANFAPVDDNNDGITTEAEFNADGKQNAWAQYSSAQRAGGLTKQEWVDLIQRRFAIGMYNPDFSKGPLGQAIDELAGKVGHNRVWDVSEIEQRLKRKGINLTLAGSPEAADGKISEQELGEFIFRNSQGSSAYLKVENGVLEKGPGAAQVDARIAAVVETPPPVAPAPISTSSDVVAYYEALKGFDLTIERSTGKLVNIENKDGSALTPQQHEQLNDKIQALEGLQLSSEEGAELISKLDAVSGVDITYVGSAAASQSAASNVWDGSIESLHAILTGAVDALNVSVGADGMVISNDIEPMHINDLLASGAFIQTAEGVSTRLTDEQIQELAGMFGNAAAPDQVPVEDTTPPMPVGGEVIEPNSGGEDGVTQQNAEDSVVNEHSSSNTVTTNSDNPAAIEARKAAIQSRLDRIAAQRAPYGGSITDPGSDMVPPPIVGGASNNGLPNQP